MRPVYSPIQDGYLPPEQNIPDWKPGQYFEGDFVKYDGNIFKAAFWAGSAPGVNANDGWRLAR